MGSHFCITYALRNLENSVAEVDFSRPTEQNSFTKDVVMPSTKALVRGSFRDSKEDGIW